MKTIRVAERAQEDLLEIWEYIAGENPESAERLLQSFREKFKLLLGHPLIGRERNEILIGLRSFPAGRYIIFTSRWTTASRFFACGTARRIYAASSTYSDRS